MTTGVALAAFNAPNYVDAIVAKARAASDAGVPAVWLGQRLDYDSASLAAIVGREVPGLTVGTSAIPIFARHPVLVASQAQTTQAATHGRYHLGIALGAPGTIEPTFGLKFQRPIALLREFLTALRTLLDTGTADFHGELLTAAPPLPTALPGAEPPIPVLVAAMGPQALTVTGELADGTLPYLAGPRTLGEQIVPTITRAAERAGRPAPRIVAFIAGGLATDLEAAREAAGRQLAFYDRVPSYQRVLGLEGATNAADLAVLGNEETVAKAVQSYRDAGATEVVFTATDLAGPDDQLRTWQLLGSLA